MAVERVDLQEIPSNATFEESAYLAANPDVAAAVAAGAFRSGRRHFEKHGRAEGRRQRVPAPRDALARIGAIRAAKLAALEPLLTRRPIAITPSGALDFLETSERARIGMTDEDPISENGYDDETNALIEVAEGGLVLDVGAGRRPVYFGNVVNYEIACYDTTDVVGPADNLPFADGTFDGVLSIAVLEHVQDPFRCAAELVRVLKPGAWLKCCVPFLQPLHGFPHHYFNMTHEGLRLLFEPRLRIERQEVIPSTHPVWALAWQLRVWANGLPNGTRNAFLRMRVKDLIAHPASLLNEPFARDLPMDKQFELAAATVLFARKGSAS